MLRHASRHAALAAALLVPTIVVVGAPPASASTTYYTNTYINDAFVQSNYVTPTGGGGDIEAVVSFDPTGDLPFDNQANDGGNLARGASQGRDGAATLHLDVYNFSDDNNSCAESMGTPTQYRIEIRNAATHALVGTTANDWLVPYSGTCDTELNYSKQVYFDTEPLDGTNDTAHPLAAGAYELYVAVEGGGANITGMTSEGGHGNGGTAGVDAVESTAEGTFTVGAGVQLGLADNRSSDGTATTNQGVLNDDVAGITGSGGKSYAAARIYDATWTEPKSEVHDLINAGKTVLWSEKPPNDASGNPSWALIADGSHDTGVGNLETQLADLYNWADGLSGHASQVIFIAVEHEPHDSASDFLSGSGTHTCGVTGKPACHGSSSDYKAAWDDVRHLVDYMNDNGWPGIRNRVLLGYTAVESNAEKKAGGIIGAGDIMYPGNSDVDILTPDMYNWYYYVAGGNGYTWDTSPTWKPPSTLLGTTFTSAGTGAVALGRYLGKQVFIAEFASHPGCPGGGTNDDGCTGTEIAGPDRDQWFRDLATYVATYDQQNTLVGFSYYHENPSHVCSPSNPCGNTVNPKWDWQFTDTPLRTASGVPTALPHGITGWNDAFVTGSNASWYDGSPFFL